MNFPGTSFVPKSHTSCDSKAKKESYRAKKQQKLHKNMKIVFFTKTVFLTILNGIWEVWGCPGAWHGMDHTMRFPRTLAGFGLTWHGGNRFSYLLEILETHFITKYLQIGPRASRLVLGFFWRPGHHLRSYKTDYFPKKRPHEKYGSGTWKTSNNLHFL